MAYEKTVWVNGQAPALDAEHLNKIEQGIADAVSVTPQTLSDDQKTQARGNIGAAPDGFGLGGDAKVLTSDDDVNTIGASGWYGWVNNNVPINAIAVTSLTIMRVDAYSSGVKVQTLYDATDGAEFIMQPIVARRMIYGSKIGAWEYVNPPMQLGVEYRTTERYLGKPVYVKAVECGTVPTNSIKAVSFDPSYDDVSTASTFRALCVWGVTTDNWTLPALLYGYGLDRSINIGGYFNGILIGTTETGAFNSTVTVVVKYIKTTD